MKSKELRRLLEGVGTDATKVLRLPLRMTFKRYP